MNRIDSYSAYQTAYTTASKQQTDKTSQVEKKDTKEVQSQKGLSEKAKNLLKELKKKYHNMDFTVARTTSDEEASELMSYGTKEYSVLIDPDELEKMANDEEYLKEQMAVLDDAPGKLKDLREQMKEQMKDRFDEVKTLGISLGADGKVSFFAYLEQTKQTEKNAATQSKKETSEKDAKDISETKDRKHPTAIPEKYQKHAFISGDTVEEILEALTKFDWEAIPETKLPTYKPRVDLTV